MLIISFLPQTALLFLTISCKTLLELYASDLAGILFFNFVSPTAKHNETTHDIFGAGKKPKLKRFLGVAESDEDRPDQTLGIVAGVQGAKSMGGRQHDPD